MRKIGMLLLAAVFLFFAAGYAAEEGLNIPKDFKLVAIAGGLAPGSKVFKVEIGQKGDCIYSVASPENKGKELFVETGRFTLPEPGMRFIYETIIANNFFTLNKEYKASDVLDGNSARLTITMNNKTHSVKTRNIKVERFDNIMIAVNIALPADKKVIYNQILE